MEKEEVFVAKVSKVKNSRSGRYFVYRFNLPKKIGEKLMLKEGDYVLFKAKKAKWYHLLDWSKMTATYQMLPDELKRKIAEDGFCSEPTGEVK
ncbi:MAG: hypothetical protein QXJ86_06770 [Nitrososphaerales archaeon]